MPRDDDRYKPDRPVFCGNFEYDASVREVERLFERYGPLDRVEMKTGFAFVYMKDRRDGDDAIRALDRREFGTRQRRLRVEWSKGDGEIKRREDLRRRQTKPTSTLFVVNFDVDNTRERDLERHFEPYGRLMRVQIKRNYAFIQYETAPMATDALKGCHMSRLGGRVISVEYVAREADGRYVEKGADGRPIMRSRSRSPYAPRARSRSPSYGRTRSPPPYRASPSPVRRRSYSRSPERPVRDRSPSRSRSRSIAPRDPSRSRSMSR